MTPRERTGMACASIMPSAQHDTENGARMAREWRNFIPPTGRRAILGNFFFYRKKSFPKPAGRVWRWFGGP